ncbi:MAG TPA: tetratricopeptide repeat protein [Gemmatimonadota bacterium]|nr:tetratricopeptide repeat protein [Gemmatimonadota bacterium]
MNEMHFSRRFVRSALLVGAIGAALSAGAGVEVGLAQDSDTFVVAVLPFSSADDSKSKDLQENMIEGLDLLGPYTLIAQDEVNESLEDAGIEPGQDIPEAKSLEVGRALGAKILARGTLAQNGGNWVAEPVFVEVATRNMQQLGSVAAGDIDDLGEQVVESFNSRNQADKHVIFGIDYARSEAYERALTNFQKALEYDADLAAAYYYMGDTYLKMDSLNAALAALEKAVEIDPAYINAYHSIGQAYLEKGDTTQAKNFFEQLVAQKPQDCQIQVAYGYVMANQLLEVDKGLAAFERAQQLCPDDPQPYQYLAYALPDTRREEKIENFKRYLELSEGKATDPEALQYLFGLYFAEEQYEGAKETIVQALAADPTDANLELYAGIVESKLGNHTAAIQHYDKAIELNSELENAYLYRALSHRETGNTAAYARDLERAGKGRSGEILANMALREAHSALQAGRTGAALESLSRAASLGANSCAVSYYRGDAYYRMGKALEGENNSVGQNQRAREMFQASINHLQNACGDYSGYAQGLIGNANQYITRVDAIIKKLSG